MATAVAQSSSLPPTNNKRKRGPGDQDGRSSKTPNTNGDGTADPTFANVHMLQGIEQHTLGGGDEQKLTAQAALATPMQQSGYPDPPGTYESTPGMGDSFIGDGTPNDPHLGTPGLYGDARHGSNSGQKPSVGTQEWHDQRKANHKEVERRRREVINEGIENIAKIVPGCEKNKGAILQRTCQYVTELQQKERSFQNERATFEIALKELTNRVERMKQTAEAAWVESNKWQQRCRDASLQFDDYDDGALPGMGEDDDVVDPAV